jgi:hypothetical protein
LSIAQGFEIYTPNGSSVKIPASIRRSKIRDKEVLEPAREAVKLFNAERSDPEPKFFSAHEIISQSRVADQAAVKWRS